LAVVVRVGSWTLVGRRRDASSQRDEAADDYEFRIVSANLTPSRRRRSETTPVDVKHVADIAEDVGRGTTRSTLSAAG